MTPPNFCPNCGHDLRPGSLANASVDRKLESGVNLTATAAGEIVKTNPRERSIYPVPKAATRADFGSDEAWAEFQADARNAHDAARYEAALEAWKREKPDSNPPVERSDLLRWYEASARVDGAANAKAIAEWREAQPCRCNPLCDPGDYTDGCNRHDLSSYRPTDKELVEWLRARRAAEEATRGRT